MSSPNELHAKISGFVFEECARQGGRQCVLFKLNHAQPGYRANELGSWHREEDPALFEDLTRQEELANKIIQRATEEADSYGTGKHRFEVVTERHLGGRGQVSFTIAAAFVGEDQNALVPAGEGGRASGGSGDMSTAVISLQMRHNERLMGINGDMFKGSIAVLASTNEALRKELTEANQTIKVLSQQLAEANDRKDERDMAAMKQIAADARKDKMIGKALPLIPLVAAKMIAGGKDKDGKVSGDPQTGIQILLGALKKSLTPAQMMKIAQPLDMQQKVLFMEALNMIDQMTPPEAPDEAQANDNEASTPTEKAG